MFFAHERKTQNIGFYVTPYHKSAKTCRIRCELYEETVRSTSKYFQNKRAKWQ